MLGLWSVAGLAIDVGVLATLLLVEDVAMAAFASFMTGEVDGLCGDVGQRVPAVMPVFSEAFWDEEAADDQEHEDARDKNRCQSQKMSGIFESIHAGSIA
jgi:hypothetical protein